MKRYGKHLFLSRGRMGERAPGRPYADIDIIWRGRGVGFSWIGRAR